MSLPLVANFPPAAILAFAKTIDGVPGGPLPGQ